MENKDDMLGGYSYRKQAEKNPYAPFIYAMVLCFGVMLGFVVNSLTADKQPMLNSRYSKIDDILNYIDQKYVDTINRTQLMDKTIEKMLSNLDPHSVYIPAQDVSEMNEGLEGNFEGIGIEFFIVQDTITVVTAISGGPSELAGVKAGDRIIKISDTIVAGVKIKDTDVKHKLRGPKGTHVKVTVLRSGSPKLLDFDIARNKIPLYSVDAAYMLTGNIGYLRISQFGSTTHQEFTDKMNKLKEQGMQKLVLDLRGNPGGYLQAATEIADELISGDKLIVYTDGKTYGRQEYKAGKQGLFEEGEVCVLIDQGSASASEILSGAIQDIDRGTVVGRTSFGKGLVQEQYDLPDHSAIRLTVARYYTPSGRCIQRSYANGSDEYYNEIYDRYARGEFIHEDSIASKDTTVYKTLKGRRVYGGGGIRPDVFVPIDTNADNDYYYTVRGFIPEFVYKYSSRNSGALEKYGTINAFIEGFNVTPQMATDFYTYAEGAGLKRNPAKEQRIAEKVKLSLKAFFAKQIWRMDGYYHIANSDDKVVNKAIEVLK
jgi:carboxyl-terminal processing protease